MVDSDKPELEALASKALDQATTKLAALGPGIGCEILVRRKFSAHKCSPWQKVGASGDFSVEFRRAIQENVDEASGWEMSLLEYDAIIKGRTLGVAYTKEIDSFVSSLPPRGSEKKFDGTAADFSAMTQRCVRINLGGGEYLLAFGPATIKSVGSYSNSRAFGIWSPAKEVQPAPSGLLNFGATVSFIVYKEYVFVLDNDTFASMTEFREVVQMRAKQALEKLSKLKFLKLKDPKAVQKLIDSSPNFAKRISASDARGFLDRLSHSGVIQCIKSFGITFEYRDRKGVITLNPNLSIATEKQQFQKLITQVFVLCAVTGDRLEASVLVPAKSYPKRPPKSST